MPMKMARLAFRDFVLNQLSMLEGQHGFRPVALNRGKISGFDLVKP